MQWTVAIGIDTHKDTHVAVALDPLGGQLDSREAPAMGAGYLALYEWAHGLGVPVFALEGAASYGAGLARFLQAAGCQVFECERPRRAERRRGKNDLIDALLAARRLLTGERLGRLRGLTGPREDLRLLLLERRSAIRARTATLNQLQATIVTGPEPLRARLGGLRGAGLAGAVTRLRPRAGEEQVLRAVLRRLGPTRAEPRGRAGRARAGAGGDRLGARPRAARRVRRRADLRRAARRLERRPGSNGQRSLVCSARRHEPGRRLERTAAAPPAEPWRRSAAEPRAARDLAQPRPLPPRDSGLLPAVDRVRQDDTRSPTLRQANAGPLLPPQAQLPPRSSLDNIEASRRGGDRVVG